MDSDEVWIHGGLEKSALNKEKRLAERADPFGMPAGYKYSGEGYDYIWTCSSRPSRKLKLACGGADGNLGSRQD